MTEDALLGTVLAGCVIEQRLGEGAMGAVYRAHRIGDFAPVVVKVLRPEVSGSAKVRARFAREGDALRRLRPHPNIVRVLGVDAGEPPCLVLELVAGPSLLERLQRTGVLPWPDAARLVRDVARGLAAIHRQGVIHRDVKPDNIRVGAAGQAKLVDFGLARDEFRSAVTAKGFSPGTPAYMAPELWRGVPATPGTDLFALGATLYELVTGSLAFDGDTIIDVHRAIAAGQRRPARALVPGLPEHLEYVLEQALEHEPRRRYRAGDELAEDLERLLHGRRPSAPTLEREGAPPLPLLGRRAWTIGRASTCDVVVDDPAVAQEHLELRRLPEGEGDAAFGALPLEAAQGAADASLDGEPIRDLVPLTPGARLRVGRVTLVLRDPRSGERVAPVHEDVERAPMPGAWVEALARAADSRASIVLLERALPDRLDLSQDIESIVAALGALPPGLGAAQARQSAHEAQTALQALRHVAGAALPGAASALAWWGQVRTSSMARVRRQVVFASSPRRHVALRPVHPPGALPLEVDLELGVLLAGADPRCHLPVRTARHAATILRLDRRLLIRANPGVAFSLSREGRVDAGPVGLVDPGCRLALGDEAWTVEADQDPVEVAGAACVVSPTTFWALAGLGHPATARALAALLDPTAHAWDEGAPPPGVDAALADLQARAHQGLVIGAGRDLGRAAGPWRDLAPSGVPQIAPWGLLTQDALERFA